MTAIVERAHPLYDGYSAGLNRGIMSQVYVAFCWAVCAMAMLVLFVLFLLWSMPAGVLL